MRNIYNFILLPFLCLTLFSCNKEDKEPKKQYSYEHFKELTKNHNERLDRIYNLLVISAKKSAQNPNENIAKSLITKKILGYFNSIGLTQVSNKEQFVMLLNGLYSKLIPQEDKIVLREIIKKNGAIQAGYIKKIIEIQANSVEEFHQKLDFLMGALAKDTRIDEKQKAQVYYIAAVAHHSYEYWAKNMPKWKMLLAALSGKKPTQP